MDEATAYGYDFPSLKVRFERLEDHLNIARAMFAQSPATYEGTHHSITDAFNNPQPIRGDIPIMIGGSGEKKTLRMVAQYADASNFFGDAERIRHLVGVLEGHCERLGRDIGEITKTRLGTIIVKPTQDEADSLFKYIAENSGMPADRLATWIVGDPDTVGETLPGAARRRARRPHLQQPGGPRPRDRPADWADARAAMLGRPQRA